MASASLTTSLAPEPGQSVEFWANVRRIGRVVRATTRRALVTYIQRNGVVKNRWFNLRDLDWTPRVK